MELNDLRESRKGATVAFTAFTTMKSKFDSSLFCSFEGDDAKYYFKRIEDETKYTPDKIVGFNCEGKSEVIRLYKLIKSKNEYESVKFLFFIDRDFDPPMQNESKEIYETPVYSIENFYSTKEAFIRICKIEFGYSEADHEYELLLKLFAERQKEFHDKTLYLNAWIACQRNESANNHLPRLNLSEFNLKKIVPVINLDRVESEYDKNILETLFPEAVKLAEQKIQEKIAEFRNYNLQEIFRGKFEIEFLYNFLEAIKTEFGLDNGRLKKKVGVKLNQSKRNMIAEFSQYATTSNCLIEYLKNFLIA